MCFVPLRAFRLLFGSIYDTNEREKISEDNLFFMFCYKSIKLLYNFPRYCLWMFSDDFIIDFRFDDECELCKKLSQPRLIEGKKSFLLEKIDGTLEAKLT